MKRLVALCVAGVVLLPAPATAQAIPEPAPTPTVTVTAPAPILPPINLDPGDDAPTEKCPSGSWRKPGNWWGCIKESIFKDYQEKTADKFQQLAKDMAAMTKTPNPFNSERVRAVWVAVLVLALVLIGILARIAALHTMFNTSYMTKGEIIKRIILSLLGAAETISLVPFLVELSNKLVDLAAYLNPGFSQSISLQHQFLGFVDGFLVIVIVMPCMLLSLVLHFLRWVVWVYWCVTAPLALSTYAYPMTDSVARGWITGTAVILLVPIAEMFLISSMIWLGATGTGIFPTNSAEWFSTGLIAALALGLLALNLWSFVKVFGLRNYSSLRNALRNSMRRAGNWAERGAY